MKNRIKMAAVAVTAAAVLAGCGRVPQGVATEPGIPAETTAPAETGYQFGDIVWVLDQWPDGTVDTSRFAVVSHDEDVILVTHAISDTSEALRECLPEYISCGDGEVWAIDAAAVFATEEAALAEIARRTADGNRR